MTNDFNEYFYLCHHGILGMKWGVRRYQNKDGSLTAAGRKRYGKKISKYAEAEENRYSKLAKKAKKKGDIATSDKYRQLKLDTHYGMTQDDWYKEMQEVKAAGKKYGKWALLGGPPLAMAVSAINMPKELEKIRKGRESVIKNNLAAAEEASRIANERSKAAYNKLASNSKLNAESDWYYGEEPGSQLKRYRNDKAYRDRMNSTADLGIKALPKLNKYWSKDQFEYDDWYKEQGYTKEQVQQSNREWFLWEDQTIGMPIVAELINKGTPAKEVKNMINEAKKCYQVDYDTNASKFIWEVQNGDPDLLEEFADACYEIKKGGNT